MTIKRSQLAAWLDSTCDKTKPYILSAIVEGKRECGMLRAPMTHSGWVVGSFTARRLGEWFETEDTEDLPWSDVIVDGIEITDIGCTTTDGRLLRFTPPPRLVTLEVAPDETVIVVKAEKWERYQDGKKQFALPVCAQMVLDSAKVKG